MKRRDVTEPARHAEAGDPLRVVLQTSEHIVIAMHNHDGADGQAHDEKGKGLQAIEVAQNVPPKRRHRLQQRTVPRKEGGTY